MRNLAGSVLIKTVLTLFLLTLLPSCSGHYPIESEDDMPKSRKKFNPIYNDPFEERVKDLNHPPGNSTPWSGNNNLGITKPFEPDTNNEQSILILPESGMPEVWTVNLGIDIQEIIDKRGFEIEAKILYGSGGATQTVLVDWKNGASISLPMNSCNVIARYKQLFSKVGGLPEVDLTVTLAKGFNTAEATYGVTPQTISAGASFNESTDGELARIPPFARKVRVSGAGNPAAGNPFVAANILTFYGVVQTTTPHLATYTGDQLLNFPDGVPIPPGARYIGFFNGTAAGLWMNFDYVVSP